MPEEDSNVREEEADLIIKELFVFLIEIYFIVLLLKNVILIMLLYLSSLMDRNFSIVVLATIWTSFDLLSLLS